MAFFFDICDANQQFLLISILIYLLFRAWNLISNQKLNKL